MADPMNLQDIVREMRERSYQIDAALNFLRSVIVKAAEAEHDFRKEKAIRFLAADGAVAQREAAADLATVHLRKERDIASGMKDAAMEAVRSRRAQLSAVQSVANAFKAEIEFARTEPGGRP